MGEKLLWTGLTLFVLASAWPIVPAANVVGAVIMVIGLVLHWLDK